MTPRRPRLLGLIAAALLALAPRLTAGPPDAEPLPEGAKLRLGTGRFRLPTFIAPVALSPDGAWIATAERSSAQSAKVYLLDRRTGAVVRTLTGGGPVERLAFSANGKFVGAAGVTDVTVWEVATGRRLASVEGTPRAAKRDGFALSDDGQRLAVTFQAPATTEVRIQVVEVATRKVLASFAPARPTVDLGRLDRTGYADFAPALSRDGARVACCVPGGEPNKPNATDALVQVWDVAAGKELARVEVGAQRAVAAAFSPDGKALYTLAVDGSVRAWDADGGRMLRRYPGRPASWHRLAVSPDGRTLAAVDTYAQVELWEAATAKRLGAAKLTGPQAGAIAGVGFPDGGPPIAITSTDLVVGVWSLPDGKLLTPDPRHVGPPTAVRFTPDGGQVVSADWKGTVIRWDAATGRGVEAVSLKAPAVNLQFRTVGPNWNHLALSPDARRAAMPHGPSGLLLHDLAHPDDTVVLPAREGAGWGGDRPAFSADGSRVAALLGNAVHVWDVRTGQPVAEVAVPADRERSGTGRPVVALPGDGSRLVVAEPLYRRGTHVLRVAAWDVKTGKQLSRAEHAGRWGGQGGLPLAVHPDGTTAAVVVPESEVVAFDLAASRVVRRTPAPWPTWTPAPEFSPDGRLLAVVTPIPEWERKIGEDRTRLRVLEWASGTVRHEFLGPYPTAVTFDPAGTTLATAVGDTSVLLWDLSPATGPRPWEQSPSEPAKLWADLTATDARRGWPAVRELIARPDVAVPLLGEKVKPARAPAATDADIGKLVAALDAPAFADREAATRELRRLGHRAVPLLKKAAEGGGPEARQRAEALLKAADQPDPDSVTHTRAVEVLERIDTPAARELLASWAGGDEGAALTREAKAALARLGRRNK